MCLKAPKCLQLYPCSTSRRYSPVNLLPEACPQLELPQQNEIYIIYDILNYYDGKAAQFSLYYLSLKNGTLKILLSNGKPGE